MAYLQNELSITTTATGPTYYTTGITAPGGRNFYIKRATLTIGSNTAPALGDFMGLATTNANAALFMLGANVANMEDNFSENGIVLPAGNTMYIFSQGWAIGTVIDLTYFAYLL